MKYIKAAIILLLILWVVTAPVAKGGTPGGLFYRWHVTVNEPVWAWIHITQQGRAETVEQQLDERYHELASAWASGEAEQDAAARAAEVTSAKRVQARLASSLKSKDYKAADTLVTHAYALTRAHRQVLRALSAKPGLSGIAGDVTFLDARMQTLEDARVTVASQFSRAYEQQGLVKGIDEKLLALERLLASADNAITLHNASLSEPQRLALEATLAHARQLQQTAKDKLALDVYVESYHLANEAQGYAMEVAILVDGIRLYEIPALPTIVPSLP